MPNPVWNDVSEFRDIESTNMYRLLQEERGKSAEEAFAIVKERSRDNSRTPMQWDDSKNAGFTTGTPWIKVDERYPSTNVAEQLADPNSIYYHYRKLIALRKQVPVLTDGLYERLDDAHPEVFAYARTNGNATLIVVSNFSEREVSFSIPAAVWNDHVSGKTAELLIGNTEVAPALDQVISLSPYASYMWLVPQQD
ncbi:Oligo-1,6-glucosidase [compost metagenome]